MIRKEAWPFYSTIFGVRLCWELEEPKGLKREAVGADSTPPTCAFRMVHISSPLRETLASLSLRLKDLLGSVTRVEKQKKKKTRVPDADALVVGPIGQFLPRSSAPGGLNMIRKEALLFCKTSSGVRLCWELEEQKGPGG